MANQLTTTRHITTILRRKRERKRRLEQGQRLVKKYPGVIQEVSECTGKQVGYLYRVLYGKETSAPMFQVLLNAFDRRIESEHKAAGAKGNGYGGSKT